MRIGLAQINTTVGDLENNVQCCVAAVQEAAGGGAELVVLPEMAIPGYPPREILHDLLFVKAVLEATKDLAARVAEGPTVIVGSLAKGQGAGPHHPGLLNAAMVLSRGAFRQTIGKRLLPAHDVFHEPRWFVPGAPSAPLEVHGRRLGIVLSGDLWSEGYEINPAAELVANGAKLLVCLSASPFTHSAHASRLFHARKVRRPVVFVNACGATDELIFDGASFVLDSSGQLVEQLPCCEEAVRVVDVDDPPETRGSAP